MQAPQSPFTGLNPYLMSFLQTSGTDESPSTFPSFHSLHIAHLNDFLNRVLPPQYIALTEPSLQIQGRDQAAGRFHKDSRVVPDITIYKPQAGSSGQSSTADAPSLVLDFEVEEEKQWMSIVIREFKATEHSKHGAPIVRIELLSPANMLNGSYAEIYQSNRQKAVMSGSKLLEIDYLHEFISPVSKIPIYPRDPEAKAYNICLSNPDSRKTSVYFWAVNEAIPLITIPLKDDDSIIFDFNAPYQYTWENSRLWFYLDYRQDPPRMESYSTADQTLIRQITKALPID